jgi:hypothetical protein
MLKIRAIMDSPVQEILGFKACCALRMFDQNLEILVTNVSDEEIRVPSHFDLKGERGWQRVDALLPYGEQPIPPGNTIAFYCMMDDKEWKAAQEIVFYDSLGNAYSTAIG